MKKENTLPSGEGLVISYFGDRVEVEAEEGVITCCLHRNQPTPVVGDNVLWQAENSQTYVIKEILPRRSVLERPDAKGKMKAIAANLDTMIIVMALPGLFTEYLIDRYIIAAELLTIQPMLILNKVDLFTDTLRENMYARLEPYKKIGYPIVFSSARTEEGLRDLGDCLKNKTGILVGPSGVGKSSLIATFAKEKAIRVGEVSNSGSGKHTTTASRLYHLQQGGALIDSPGIREFNLWPMTMNEILKGFIEFNPYLGECRFRDCRHIAEPNCAIREAVANNKISTARYENFQRLVGEFCQSPKSRAR